LLLTNSEVSTFAVFTGQNARTAAILTQQCTGVTDQMYDDIQNYNIGENDIDNEWQNIYENSLQTTHTLVKDYSETHPYYAGIAKVLMAMNLGLAADYWGDIPFREALSGLDGEEYYYPHFDSQQQYRQCLMKPLHCFQPVLQPMRLHLHLMISSSWETSMPGSLLHGC